MYLIYLLATGALIFFYWLFCKNEKEVKWLLENGIVTIGTISCVTDWSRGGWGTFWIKANYLVDSGEYEVGGWSLHALKMYEIGDKVRVFYDPKSPSEATIYEVAPFTCSDIGSDLYPRSFIRPILNTVVIIVVYYFFLLFFVRWLSQ